MLKFLIGTILGFAAGCSLKDIITSKFGDLDKSSSMKAPECKRPLNAQKLYASGQSEKLSEFNLCSILPLFEKYKIDLVGVNSFSILLDKLERVTYLNTLKLFAEKVSTPEDLIALIEQGETYDEPLLFEKSFKNIMISEDYINQIFAKNNIDYASIDNIEEKVQLLVSLYISKGLKQFQNTMGPSLEQFISDYKEQKDVSVIFESIMKKINKALSFMS